MSLIMDATRAAQREKERREGSAGGGRVPLLVPLRSKGVSGINWRRVSLFAGGGVVLAAAGWVFLLQSRNSIPRALRTPGPVISSIATPPASGAARDTLPTKEISRVVEKDPADVQPGVGPQSASKQGVIRPPRPAAARAPVAAPRASRQPGTAASSSTEQLRVAVETPRAQEVARLFAVGVAAQRAGDVAAARSAYEQLLALAPGDVDALNNLGVLHTGLREFDRAEVALRRALSLSPQNAGAWSNLGTVLRERGRAADAIAAFQYALSIDPHHAGARVGLAQQYLMIGSLPQARQSLEDVLRDNPGSPEANYTLGQVLERQGDRVAAIRAFTMFMRVAPPALAPYVESVRRHVETLSSRVP